MSTEEENTWQGEMAMDTNQTVNVMLALNDALAVATGHSGTVEFVQLRLWGQQRRTAVLDAIKHELVERNNRRLAKKLPPIGKLGLVAHLPCPWLSKSMEHARAHELKMMETAGIM